jgi:hypothetical protein
MSLARRGAATIDNGQTLFQELLAFRLRELVHLGTVPLTDIRDQCRKAGVAFYFKQWGGVFKKRHGRTLDGRTWDEMPDTPSPSAPTRQLELAPA